MADIGLPTPSYVKDAFSDQHNLLFLLGAACFSAAFASAVPLLLGAAGEILWLLLGTRLPAFRDWVDTRESAQYLARAEVAIAGAIAQLSPPEARRFVSVSEQAAELGSSAGRVKPISAHDLQIVQHSLLELRRTFLDYQFLAQRVTTLLLAMSEAEREQEILRLEESYGKERELIARMSIRQALGAAQRQLRQRQALESVERLIAQRLTMLERAAPRLRERLAEPHFGDLSQELESALTEVGPAQALELAVDEALGEPGPIVAA
jgi:hypothetical protein